MYLVFHPKSSNSEQFIPFYGEKLSFLNWVAKKVLDASMFTQEMDLKYQYQALKTSQFSPTVYKLHELSITKVHKHLRDCF